MCIHFLSVPWLHIPRWIYEQPATTAPCKHSLGPAAPASLLSKPLGPACLPKPDQSIPLVFSSLDFLCKALSSRSRLKRSITTFRLSCYSVWLRDSQFTVWLGLYPHFAFIGICSAWSHHIADISCVPERAAEGYLHRLLLYSLWQVLLVHLVNSYTESYSSN